MVELDLAPVTCSVACITSLAILPLVLVIIAVTCNTAGSEVFIKQTATMAGITGDLAMFSGQRIIGIPVVIKYDLFPV